MIRTILSVFAILLFTTTVAKADEFRFEWEGTSDASTTNWTDLPPVTWPNWIFTQSACTGFIYIAAQGTDAPARSAHWFVAFAARGQDSMLPAFWTPVSVTFATPILPTFNSGFPEARVRIVTGPTYGPVIQVRGGPARWSALFHGNCLLTP